MQFSLTIDTDNAAFEDTDSELKRCLEATARVVGCSGTFRGEGPILDVNGNTVGRWTLS